MRLQIGRRPHDDRLFRLGERTQQHASRDLQNHRGRLAAAFHFRFRETARSLDKLRIVQRHERLQRRVRALAAHRASLARRRVEDLHVWRRRLAFPKVVDRPAIQILARVLRVTRTAEAHDFPDVGRLVRLRPRPAHLRRQRAARGQRVVAHHLRIHAETRPARQQPVLRILLDLFRRDVSRLPVRRRCHDEREKFLHIPARFAELHRQPVEQFLIRRTLALRAEILRRFHQPGAENFLPETIHRHARRERIFRRDEPAREAEPVLRSIRRHRVQRTESRGRDRFAHLVIRAAHQDVRHRLARLFLLDVRDGRARFDRRLLLLEFLEAEHRLDGRPVEIVHVEIQQRRLLRRRALFRRDRKRRAQRLLLRQRTRLARAQLARIHAHILHLPALEFRFRLALPDAQRHRGARGALQISRRHHRLHAAIEEKAEPGGCPRAVVGHQHMLPFSSAHARGFGNDTQRARRLRRRELHAEIPALHKQLPALRPLAIIHARHDRALIEIRRHIHPRADGERLVALEVREIPEVKMRAVCERRRASEFPAVAPFDRPAGFERHLRRPALTAHLHARALRERQHHLQRLGADVHLRGLRRRDPRCKILRRLAAPLRQRRVCLRDGPRQFRVPFFIRRRRQVKHRLRVLHIAVARGLRGVPKVRRHRVKIFLRDRIEFVVVARRAIRREPEPHPRSRRHAVIRIQREIFLRDGSALRGRHVAAVKARRQQLIARRVREQIARDLLDREFIEPLVAVERRDHPIAIRPHLPVVINVDAVRVRIPRRIEPVPTAVLAPLRYGHEFCDELFIRVRRGVFHECLDLLRLRRQPREIERKPPRQRAAIRFRRRLQSRGIQRREDEAINRIPHPRLVLHHRQCRALRRLKGPVPLVFRTLLDPAFDDLFFRRAQRLVRLRRRHHLVLVVADNPQPRVALFQIPRHDRAHAIEVRGRAFRRVEPAIRLASLRIEAVAKIAFVRKDRPHVMIESDLRRHRHLRGRDKRCGETENEQKWFCGHDGVENKLCGRRLCARRTSIVPLRLRRHLKMGCRFRCLHFSALKTGRSSRVIR